MHEFYVEQRSVSNMTALPVDLTRHILLRHSEGTIVAAHQPNILVDALKKQWLKLMRQAQQQRTDREDAIGIVEFTSQIAWMQSIDFRLADSDSLDVSGVVVGSPNDLIRSSLACSTLYTTCPVEREQLYLLSSWMRPGSLIIEYSNTHNKRRA